jgi:hypothetical protein
MAEKTKAAQFFEAAHETLGNLYSRWLDEHEYEDINDYQLPLNPIAEKFGVKITKMTKKPFGCHFETDLGKYVFTCTLRSVTYKKVA